MQNFQRQRRSLPRIFQTIFFILSDPDPNPVTLKWFDRIRTTDCVLGEVLVGRQASRQETNADRDACHHTER
jgi:hypothetical protein